MSHQAICIAPGDSGLLVRGREYTVIPVDTDFVRVPGFERDFSADRFEPVGAPQATTPAPPPPGAAVAPAGGLAGTLAARGTRYGSFETNGRIAQALKSVMRDSPNWSTLSGAQAEALDMFASKISRLLTGDPDYVDNWHDIQGYASLVEDTLTKN